MRKLMWFVLGYAGACTLCVYCMPEAQTIPLCVVSLVGSAGFFVIGGKWRRFLCLAVGFLGFSAGILWFSVYEQQYLSPAKLRNGEETEVSFRITDTGYQTEYGMFVDGYLMVEDMPYQTRIYLDDAQVLQPGDQIRGSFLLSFTVPEGEQDALYYAGKGIFLTAYQRDDIEIIASETIPIWAYPAFLRMGILQRLNQLFSEDLVPFAKALLLGDSTDLSYQVDTDFKISGIRHIIAVSGLHVSLIYSLIRNLSLRNRFLTALLGIPCLALFSALAGFTPSVNRACMMIGLMMFSQLLEREYDGLTELSFASLVMLVLNPMVISSVSFQLSVGCVAGILLFSGSIQAWLIGLLPEIKGKSGKLWRNICSALAVTLSAMSLTTPLSAWYFGSVSLIGVISNLILLWAVNLLFQGMVVSLLISLVSMSLARILCWFLSGLMRLILACAGMLASLPLAAVYTVSPYITAWLVFCYALLLVTLISSKRKPGILFGCLVTGLCAALLASWTEPMLWDTRMTVLDVGQGQSIVLQSEGRSFLVDCGGDRDNETADIISEYLLSQGSTQLDGIILTHCDHDHAGALENLLTRIDTQMLLLPAVEKAMQPPLSHGRVLYVDENLEIQFGQSHLVIYGPIYQGHSNENSLCVLFDTENCDILITGDRSEFGERILLRSNVLPNVDVLVAGHHGASDSTSYALLDAVKPETVMISVGAENRYGHPSPELLTRLMEYGCRVFRTDRDGTIIFRR